MTHGKCLKCGNTRKLSFHHVLPKVFFGGRGRMICLCQHDHHRIEDIILGVESFVGKVPFSNRHKLKEEDYEYITKRFVPHYSPHRDNTKPKGKDIENEKDTKRQN